MDVTAFLAANWYSYLFIPALIFFARIMDVSIGTVRVIFITRGFRLLAPLLGFVEVIIWLVAIQNILANLTNVMCYIAYGGGFAMGTYIGMVIEERISIGRVLIRVITRKDAKDLLEAMVKARYVGTTTGAEGPDGSVNLIISVIKRHDIRKVLALIKKHDPRAFYAIEDVRFAREDVEKAVKPKRKIPSLFMRHAARK
jgi:uncharacterized protein YebE (UPF0316 family)